MEDIHCGTSAPTMPSRRRNWLKCLSTSAIGFLTMRSVRSRRRKNTPFACLTTAKSWAEADERLASIINIHYHTRYRQIWCTYVLFSQVPNFFGHERWSTEHEYLLFSPDSENSDFSARVYSQVSKQPTRPTATTLPPRPQPPQPQPSQPPQIPTPTATQPEPASHPSAWALG